LGRIFEHVLKDQATVDALPKKLQEGIRRIYRMTQDAFKYASDEDARSLEAFLGMGGPEARLQGIRDYISKAISGKELPQPVLDSLLDTQSAIEKELGGMKQTKEEKREQRAEQSREKIIQKGQRKDEALAKEDAAVTRLKNALMGSKHYAQIYNGLPPEIRREMEKLSLDPPNLKYLMSTKSVFASRAIVDRYLGS
jgi:hypothetical protein